MAYVIDLMRAYAASRVMYICTALDLDNMPVFVKKLIHQKPGLAYDMVVTTILHGCINECYLWVLTRRDLS